MSDEAKLPDHQTIEDAFKKTNEVVGTLPNNLEHRRAEEHLKIAEGYAHDSRERKADR
jgi:hypothetical protein